MTRRPGPSRRHRARNRAPGVRQAADRAVQVSARDRVRRDAPADADREAAALQASRRRSAAMTDSAAARLAASEGVRLRRERGGHQRVRQRPDRLGRARALRRPRFRRSSPSGAAQHRDDLGRGRRRSTARRALTWFVTDKREYLAAQREVGAAYREVMGRPLPGDVGRRGGGAARGRSQSRDRGDRGRTPLAAGGLDLVDRDDLENVDHRPLHATCRPRR